MNNGFNNNNVITGRAKGGFMYTLAVLGALVFSCIFSLVISMVASSEGVTVQDIENSDAYRIITFLPGSLAIFSALFIFIKKLGKSEISMLSIKKVKPKFYVVAFLLPVGMLLGLGNLNELFLSLLRKIGYSAPVAQLPSFSATNLIWAIIIICILPPLFEELLFRGVITSSLKSMGKYGCALAVGGLFSLYHMNPQQTVYQFIVGFIFTLVAIESESVFPTVIAHVLNNLAVVLTEYFYPLKFSGITLVITTTIGLIALGVCLALTLTNKNTKGEKEGSFIKWIGAIGVIVCAFNWIVNLLTYTL